jgi:hypothetical protein
MSRAQFETCLRLSRIPSAPPVFRDLVIYPPAADGTVYVAGSYLPDLSAPGRYRPFEMRVPPGESGGDGTDLRAHIAAGSPQVSFRFAWWRSPLMTAGACFAASVLIVGVGIPFTLRRLLPPVALAAAAHVDQPASSNESDAELLPDEERLHPPPAPPDDANVDTAAAPVAVLSDERVAAPPPPNDQSTKEYRGEFYPVARPGSAQAAHG